MIPVTLLNKIIKSRPTWMDFEAVKIPANHDWQITCTNKKCNIEECFHKHKIICRVCELELIESMISSSLKGERYAWVSPKKLNGFLYPKTCNEFVMDEALI